MRNLSIVVGILTIKEWPNVFMTVEGDDVTHKLSYPSAANRQLYHENPLPPCDIMPHLDHEFVMLRCEKGLSQAAITSSSLRVL